MVTTGIQLPFTTTVVCAQVITSRRDRPESAQDAKAKSLQ